MARKTHRGNVANEFVRVILTDIGLRANGFSKADWQRTLEAFDYKCAYTGATLDDGPLDRDHAVPLNRKHGGLHVFGNVVPATRLANSQKSGTRYDEFLRSDSTKLTSLAGRTPEQREEAIKRIEDFMAAARPDQLLDSRPEMLAYYDRKYQEILTLCATTNEETAALLKQLGAMEETAESETASPDDDQLYASAEDFERDEQALVVLPAPYDRLFEEFENRKIGAFAQAVFTQLFADNRIAPYLELLQDAGYSRRQLGLYFPALARQRGTENKYYATPYTILNGHEYYLCNDWYRSKRTTFEDWLTGTVFSRPVRPVRP